MSENIIAGPEQLSAEDQKTFDQDIVDLRSAGIANLEGRVKFGLDPAAMLAVRDTLPLAQRVAESQGTSVDDIRPLIAKLHAEGPWQSAEQLHAANDPAIRSYIVLADACRESAYPGYGPKEYLADRARVLSELGSFTPDQFDARKAALMSRVTIEKVLGEGKVPITEGYAALPLSIQGYRGCVEKAGEMRFAQTTKIDDLLLEQAGLVKGFIEVYSAEKNGFERVLLDDARAQKGRLVWVKSDESGKELAAMEPAAKRIAPGYVLTYKNEELAVQLVLEAIHSGRVPS